MGLLQQFAQFLATLCSALFAGAALYINVAEHPARMVCDTRTAITVWAPSYKRATLMQAPLAMAGFVAGVIAWLSGGGPIWLAVALLIGSVVPFTLIVIMPTNRRLLAPDRDPAWPETRKLLERWGALHAVRTALSLGATLLSVWVLAAT